MRYTTTKSRLQETHEGRIFLQQLQCYLQARYTQPAAEISSRTLPHNARKRAPTTQNSVNKKPKTDE